MSFSEQVRLFQEAKVIVLVGGASMANLIFCKPGVSVIILYPDFLLGYEMPSILASVAEANVEYVYGKSLGNVFRDKFVEKLHPHFTVSVNNLGRVLSEIKL
jgi:hypothetical protein